MPAENQDINPDPTRYQVRPQPTFTSETSEMLGIIESWWEPREAEGESPADRRRPLSLPRDLLGYRPLRLWFGMPHVAGREKSDDWFEVLFSTLFELSEDLCASTFGVDRLSLPPASPASSPWADPALSSAFLYYASEVARQDRHDGDGGWDALLADPRQRAFLAQGVLAKTLDEHVFAALLFGGTAGQQDALGHWDRIMLKEEGYLRKFKRCEEVQYFLGGGAGGHVVTPFFWAEVARVTVHTAQLLLPLLNVQRARTGKGTQGPAPAPSLPVFYQRLHDVVALAGYASLCMAWSTSIFQVDFPEPGMPWEVDQEREADEHVYAVSEAKALAAVAAAASTEPHGMLGGNKQLAYIHAAKVKIVLWPRIARLKPHWNLRRTDVRSATEIILTKSHNAYYYGVRAGSASGGNDDHDHDHGADGADDVDTAASEDGSHDSHHATANATEGDDDAWPYLHEYVAIVRTARRRAHTLRWVRRLAMAWVVVSLVAWAAGMTFLEELSKAAGLDFEGFESVSGIRKTCIDFLDRLVAAVPPISRWPSQIVALTYAR